MVAPIVLALALALFVTSCGDDDAGDIGAGLDSGGVNCAALKDQPYRFLSTVTYNVEAPVSPTPEGVPPGPDPITLTQQIAGVVEDADSYQADMSLINGAITNTSSAVRDGNSSWLKTTGDWTEQSGEYELVPYRPLELCEAMAPDIDVGTATGVTEDVNGISSARLDLAALETDWPDRSTDFGPGSDVATLINAFNGSVWVAAAGSYISKAQLTGDGIYPDGSLFHFEISYEVSEYGAAITVVRP
jgi:hypothetical protein